MKLREKFVLLHHGNGEAFKRARRELEEYDFPGHVDFAEGPTCTYNKKYNVVLPTTNSEQPFSLLIDGEIVPDPMNEEDRKFLQAATLDLSRKFNLQDFFDSNKDAVAIVFYVTEGGSIFHEGARVRPMVWNGRE